MSKTFEISTDYSKNKSDQIADKIEKFRVWSCTKQSK